MSTTRRRRPPMYVHSLVFARYTDLKRDPDSPAIVAKEIATRRDVVDVRRFVAWHRELIDELERLAARDFMPWKDLQAHYRAAEALGTD